VSTPYYSYLWWDRYVWCMQPEHCCHWSSLLVANRVTLGLKQERAEEATTSIEVDASCQLRRKFLGHPGFYIQHSCFVPETFHLGMWAMLLLQQCWRRKLSVLAWSSSEKAPCHVCVSTFEHSSLSPRTWRVICCCSPTHKGKIEALFCSCLPHVTCMCECACVLCRCLCHCF